MINTYVEGIWETGYTPETFRRSVLDKIFQENVWYCGYNKYLDCIFSALSFTNVNAFFEDMNLMDFLWKEKTSGVRIDVGGERGDGYYFVIKIGPKYGLRLHGIGAARCFDAESCPKSCEIADDAILKELKEYLSVAVKAIKAKKEFDSTTYKAKLAYTTALDLLGVNMNWSGSGHTDLL